MRGLLVVALAALGVACGDVECQVGDETVSYSDCDALSEALGEVDSQLERAALQVCYSQECE